jgi:uncharacterized protein YkwD
MDEQNGGAARDVLLYFVVPLILLGAIMGGAIIEYPGLIDLDANEPTPVPAESQEIVDEPRYNTSAIELHLYLLVNQEREEQGLDPLTRYKRVDNVSRYHAVYNAANEKVTHYNPNGSSVSDRHEKFDICDGRVGENVVGGHIPDERNSTDSVEKQIAQRLFETWMNSQSHYDNMLDPNWTNTGMGVVINRDSYVAAVQNFCEQKPQPL